MTADLRTYTMVPGRLNAWLKLHDAEGLSIQIRHLGKPIGVFTTEVGELNQVMVFWAAKVRRIAKKDVSPSPPIPTGRPTARRAPKPAMSRIKKTKSSSRRPFRRCDAASRMF
jgi:hypothetical protein